MEREPILDAAARLAAIVESSSDAIISVSLKGDIVYWNQGAERLYGYSAEEVRGKPISILVPADRVTELASIVERMRRGQVVEPYETVLVRKNGDPIHVVITASAIRGADGGIEGFSWVGHDATVRKHMEEELRQKADLFQSIFRGSPIAIEIYDANGSLIDANQACLDLFGTDLKSVKGFDLFDDPNMPDEAKGVLRKGKSTRYEARFDFGEVKRLNLYETRRTGVIDLDVLITPLNVEQGRVTGGYLIQIQDITERKRAEQVQRQARNDLELRVSERTAELAEAIERLRQEVEERQRLLGEVERLAGASQRRADELETVIASIADAVFVCDRDGRIVDVNEAAMRLFGIPSKQDVVLSATDYLRMLNLRHPDGRPVADEALALTLALNGEVVRGYEEIAMDLRSGRDISLLVSAAPIRDRAGAIVGSVEVISDISPIRELDRLKDEFIAVAAHELKTPVAIMKGYAQAMLRSSEHVDVKHRRMLDAINRGADRIDRVVKDLLDISRLHLGSLELVLERIDVPELVTEVADRMALTTTKHRITMTNTEPVVVRGDRDRLEQVMLNLIENAIKYSPRGGEIELGVAMRSGQALVSVTDHGVGIPNDRQGNVFQRFYSAHTGTAYDFGGMGVGLYISREIVSRHGGTMWFESKEGIGSTFYVSLPLGQA